MAVTGGAAIKLRLALIRRNVNDAVEGGMDDLSKRILSKSRNFAPQLTGRMIRESDVASLDSRSLGTFRRAVFYSVDYAVFQHEGEFNPGPITASKPAAGRKYLSRAFDQEVNAGVRKIGRDVERAIRISVR